MELGIAGSAKLQGTTHTAGPYNDMSDTKAHPAVKRAVIFWCVAVGVLVVFHVGGASFE